MLLIVSTAALADTVIIPEGTTSIEEEAFSGCSAINKAYVPDSVTSIGAEAFSGCGEALWIITEPGSTATDYSMNNQIDYSAGTQYRALLVCQTYPGTKRELEGPATDQQAMYGCLTNMDTTKFTVRACSNLGSEEIISAIGDTFSTTNENDVSLFYYSGHGDENGNLICADKDFTLLSPSTLKSSLDRIPGRKIIIVDACYSGILIDEDASMLLEGTNANEARSFVTFFQSVFRRRMRGMFNDDPYFVITAAHANEESMEAQIENSVMGLFTYGFCLGCGWNGINDSRHELLADQNGDRAVSIQEAFEYARQIPARYDVEQTAAVWPADCRWFAPFRR